MSTTIKYDPIQNERKHNIFIEEYYSGVDCNIYVENMLCDNVAGIGFSLQEQLKPLYGYASRVFDDVAVGNRIVMGVIRLPINNPSPTDLVVENNKLNLSDEVISSIPENNISTGIYNDYYPDNTIPSVPDWVKNSTYKFNIAQTESANIDVIHGYKEYISKGIPQSDVILREQQEEKKIPYTNEILEAQYALGIAGYDIDKNGTTDTKTSKAILKFQLDHGLPATGVLDIVTKQVLHNKAPYSEKPIVITKEGLDVYIGPGFQYAIFDTINVGTTLRYISYHNEFVKVMMPDKREGYVIKSKIDQWLNK